MIKKLDIWLATWSLVQMVYFEIPRRKIENSPCPNQRPHYSPAGDKKERKKEKVGKERTIPEPCTCIRCSKSHQNESIRSWWKEMIKVARFCTTCSLVEWPQAHPVHSCTKFTTRANKRRSLFKTQLCRPRGKEIKTKTEICSTPTPHTFC